MGDTEAKGWWFAQVPIWLLCDPDISEGAKALFGYLKWRQGTDAACWPSKATQSTDMGVSIDTIDRRQSELEKEGYLIKHLRPGRSNLYQMIADPKGKQAAFEKREEERRREKYPPAKIPGGENAGEGEGQKSGGEGGAKTPPHDDNHGTDNQGRKSSKVHNEPEICSSCGKPKATDGTNSIKDLCTCDGEAEIAAFFGNGAGGGKENRLAPPNLDRPWRDWSDGNFNEREGVSVESQDRVSWLVEKYGGLRPTGSYVGWGNGAIATYLAGRGDWDSIEAGIAQAFAREQQYRPGTLACSKKNSDQNGIVKAVAREWAARNVGGIGVNGKKPVVEQGYIPPTDEQVARDRELLREHRERSKS